MTSVTLSKTAHHVSDYPQRLRECADAPIILYYKGNADLNQSKIISIVGTRQCTQYGIDLIRRFVSDLRRHCPEMLIVSGLAYGVDINAHRQALAQGYESWWTADGVYDANEC